MNATQSIEITDFFASTEAPGSEAILADSKKFDEWDINSLIDFLKHSHFGMRKYIIDIYDLAQKVCVKHSDKHPELSKLTAALFLFFDDLSFHLRKEEQILFPNIIQLIRKAVPAGTTTYSTFGLIKECALVLQNEHKAAVKELKLFRQLTNNYLIPADACRYYKHLFERMKEFEKELMLQIHLESDILFPRAIQMDETFIQEKKKKSIETNIL